MIEGVVAADVGVTPPPGQKWNHCFYSDERKDVRYHASKLDREYADSVLGGRIALQGCGKIMHAWSIDRSPSSAFNAIQ